MEFSWKLSEAQLSGKNYFEGRMDGFSGAMGARWNLGGERCLDAAERGF